MRQSRWIFLCNLRSPAQKPEARPGSRCSLSPDLNSPGFKRQVQTNDFADFTAVILGIEALYITINQIIDVRINIYLEIMLEVLPVSILCVLPTLTRRNRLQPSRCQTEICPTDKSWRRSSYDLPKNDPDHHRKQRITSPSICMVLKPLAFDSSTTEDPRTVFPAPDNPMTQTTILQIPKMW